MMFVVHTRRLERVPGSGAGERTLAFFMWSEPYVAASFLFIAGASLALGHESAGGALLRKTLTRALVLYALAVLLFVPQYGLELPDLVASPGILSAIALAIALTALALTSRAPDLSLAALALSVLGITAWLDRSGATVPGLNAGPGGAFPLVSFTALGALVMRGWRKRGLPALGLALAVSLPFFVVTLVTGAVWTTTRASMYRVHQGALALTSLGSDAPRAPAVFWNHSAWGALGLAAPLVASLGLLLLAGRRLGWSPVLGRHALAAYVIHLGLLGVIDLAGLNAASPWQTWAQVAGLGAVCMLAAVVLERRRKTG